MHFPRDVPDLVDGTGEGTVVLRAHREDDVTGCYEQCQDPLSQAWTTVPVPYTRDDARRFVREAMPGGWQTDQEWAFAIEYAGEYGGTVSLRNEGEGRAEIAYGSHPRVRGQGVIERALRLLLEWGFANEPHGRGLQTVIWWANRGNWASRRLAWRLGFSFDATLRQWLPQRGHLLDAWVGVLLTGDERTPRTHWIQPATIDSPRLPIRLRPAREDDIPRAVEGISDPVTTRWLGGIPVPYPAERGADFVLSRQERMAAGGAWSAVVADANDDRLLAELLLDLDPVHRSAEVGYWTHPAERERGVMTEAVRLAARHALLPQDVGGLGLVKVWALAALDNPASRAVLKGAGLVEVGTSALASLTRDGLRDAMRYELLATELPR